jgi:oligo-1,6-glucosidase
MLTTFIMTMRGTPYYYQGDELGMTNPQFNSISDYNDVAALNEYQHLKQTGGDIPTFIETLKFSNRDNGRTPFQWDSTASAGFTKGTPWLKVNPNYKTINKVAQDKEANSILNYFREAVQLRKNNPVLVYGKYTLVDKDNPDVYAYTRELNGVKFLIVLNFREKSVSYQPGTDLGKASIMISNYTAPSTGKTLQPFEALVYKL